MYASTGIGGPRLPLDGFSTEPPRTVDGVIQDPGLDLFWKADWHLRGR